MAIFKRRTPREFFSRIKEGLWPAQGWGRTLSYYRHRIFRTGDSVYKITAGLATGAAVSWSPFFGTHFAQAVFFSWLMKANLLAGFIGTAWGNPWTFPLMFWAGYKLGISLCGLFGLSDFVALPENFNLQFFVDDPGAFFAYLLQNPVRLLLPLTIGGYICALLFWPVAYAILYHPVRMAHRAYSERRAQRRTARRIARKRGKR